MSVLYNRDCQFKNHKEQIERSDYDPEISYRLPVTCGRSVVISVYTGILHE